MTTCNLPREWGHPEGEHGHEPRPATPLRDRPATPLLDRMGKSESTDARPAWVKRMSDNARVYGMPKGKAAA